jgi:putative flippase GtrA
MAGAVSFEDGKAAKRASLFERIVRLFPPGQFARYLGVGVWNSLFGIGSYALLLYVLGRMLPPRYLLLTVDVASVLATPLNITMAYFCYKIFVFKTRGNYRAEWLRCFAVYGAGMIPGLIVLPVLTRALQAVPVLHRGAAYYAGVLLIGVTTIFSFLGHRKVTFRLKDGNEAGRVG